MKYTLCICSDSAWSLLVINSYNLRRPSRNLPKIIRKGLDKPHQAVALDIQKALHNWIYMAPAVGRRRHRAVVVPWSRWASAAVWSWGRRGFRRRCLGRRAPCREEGRSSASRPTPPSLNPVANWPSITWWPSSTTPLRRPFMSRSILVDWSSANSRYTLSYSAG